MRHFPGTLFPISPVIARLIPNLFALNERVVLAGAWKFGFCSMTAVGAYNVGSIAMNFDASVQTNKLRRSWRNPNLEYLSFGGVGCFACARARTPCLLLCPHGSVVCWWCMCADDTVYPAGAVCPAKGEEVGTFRLGSTIVLIFEAPAHYRFAVQPGEKVRLGQPLGSL